MKKILFLLLSISAFGQTGNYVKTTIYRDPTTTVITNPTITQAAQQVVFYDGLGRPIQKLNRMLSGEGTNLIQHIEYDNLGRQTRDYLPYSSPNTGLDFETYGQSNTLTYPPYAGQYPYSDTEFEASDLGRILKQSAPGESWTMGSGHEIRYEYSFNSEYEVKRFKAVSTDNSGIYTVSLTQAGTNSYPANELFKVITKNENWTEGTANTTEEFKDKEGHVVLKRTYGDSMVDGVLIYVTHNTYYVYDQYGNLVYVIPPIASDEIVQNVLDDICYQYKYDHRNRMVEKKLPGKAWEYLIYDKLDRVIASGPTLSPFTNLASPNNIGWLITKYDIFNRVVCTGWLQESSFSQDKRKLMQGDRNSDTVFNEARGNGNTIDGIDVDYTNLAWPEEFKLLTVNYYDVYGFVSGEAVPSDVEGASIISQAKGLVTGNWNRVLTTTASITGETSTVFYDDKARVLCTHIQNYLTGYSQTDSKLDFNGNTLYTIFTHQRTSGDPEITVRNDYTYTDQNRLLSEVSTINPLAGVENPELLSKNEYDAMGQLIKKNVGGTDLNGFNAYQEINYSYNIRGWLTGINNTDDLIFAPDIPDLFAFKINYNTMSGDLVDVYPQFNGNISETFWRTSSDNVLRKYGYKYDQMNRLIEGVYQKPDALNPNTNSYNEKVSYDRVGNIITLQRNGEYDDNVYALEIDDLTYKYDLNQQNKLLSVADATLNTHGFKDGANIDDDYSYDEYGNMTADKNKDIHLIKYNHLNLPIRIYLSNNRTIQYLYSATGKKLSKTVIVFDPNTFSSNIKVTDYLNGFQYENGILQFFPTSEGYVRNTVVNNENDYNYVYNYTDHLGNVRLSYGWDTSENAVKVIEENNYYPYGLTHSNYNVSKKDYSKWGRLEGIFLKGPYRYKYNGKERQYEFDINIDDYGARNYDPALGRWMNIDPLAEVARKWSPYTYGNDNPVVFVDPDGMSAVGADGLTNEQWIQASKPANSGNGLDTAFRQQNKDKERKFDNNARKYLSDAGFSAEKNISNMPEEERQNYLSKMINSVIPLSILYNSIGIAYQYEKECYNCEAAWNPRDDKVWVAERSFTTNLNLFGNLFHEGIHGFDDLTGNYDIWEEKYGLASESIKEMRGYEAQLWFGLELNEKGKSAYPLFKAEADKLGNFHIGDYGALLQMLNDPIIVELKPNIKPPLFVPKINKKSRR